MTDQPENPQPDETVSLKHPKRVEPIELERIKLIADDTQLIAAPLPADDDSSVITDDPSPAKISTSANRQPNPSPTKAPAPANHRPLTHALDDLHHRDWLRWLFIPVLIIGLGILALSILVNHYHPAPPAPVPLLNPLPTTIIVPGATPVVLKTAHSSVPHVIVAPVIEKHLAPPGVYYLKKRISITTNDGVYGVEAGAQVLLLQKNGDTYHVTNGPHDFSVNADDLTNDLDQAQKIIRQTVARGHKVEPPPPSNAN